MHIHVYARGLEIERAVTLFLSHKSVPGECVFQESPTRVSHESPTRVSRSVPKGVFHSAPKECRTRELCVLRRLQALAGSCPAFPFLGWGEAGILSCLLTCTRVGLWDVGVPLDNKQSLVAGVQSWQLPSAFWHGRCGKRLALWILL